MAIGVSSKILPSFLAAGQGILRERLFRDYARSDSAYEVRTQ